MKATDLNESQQKAVDRLDGPVLILAGAGSGKTKTLTYRIAKLLGNGVSANKILAVTFTNKAASEMRERVETLLASSGQHVFLPYLGTFHSICVKILRQDGTHIGVPANFTIYDEQDKMGLIKDSLKRHNIDSKQISPRSVSGIISNMKNELTTIEEFAQSSNSPLQKAVIEIYPDYERALKQSMALDFDDLLKKTVVLLRDIPDVRQKWRDQFDYIMIDEYQDTNQAQYEIVRLLVNEKKNLCVVGDDWQSIYSWRGANYQNILNFKKDYPDTLEIKLEQNYRSTQAILDAAHKVIMASGNKSSKQLWTAKQGGAPVQVAYASSGEQEAQSVVSLIMQGTREGGRAYNDFAVLYRTNAQSRILEETFIRYGLPYRVVGGTRFYDRQEIKDMLGYIRLVYQPDDWASFNRVSKFVKGFGGVSANKLMQYSIDHQIGVNQAIRDMIRDSLLPAQALKSLSELMLLIDDASARQDTMKLSELVEYIINSSGYLDTLDNGEARNIDRIENVKELTSVASEYDGQGLEVFLEEVALLSSADNRDSSALAVTLMTFHAAKGLEFPVVFMVGMDETIFPSSRSVDSTEALDEERRLCYVGMTRAKEELYLLTASSRSLYGRFESHIPSRFLSDIEGLVVKNVLPGGSTYSSRGSAGGAGDMTPSRNDYFDQSTPKPSRPKVRIGDKVRHQTLGLGEIVDLDDSIAFIRFAGKTRQFNLEYAPLELVS